MNVVDVETNNSFRCTVDSPKAQRRYSCYTSMDMRLHVDAVLFCTLLVFLDTPSFISLSEGSTTANAFNS